jgi:hypothetical protein
MKPIGRMQARRGAWMTPTPLDGKDFSNWLEAEIQDAEVAFSHRSGWARPSRGSWCAERWKDNMRVG